MERIRSTPPNAMTRKANAGLLALILLHPVRMCQWPLCRTGCTQSVASLVKRSSAQWSIWIQPRTNGRPSYRRRVPTLNRCWKTRSGLHCRMCSVPRPRPRRPLII
uniref:Putative secreted protein n=1 Tax=Anopheles darlingi TaxID=43151 RepID=A0A2M4DGT9_ANODA